MKFDMGEFAKSLGSVSDSDTRLQMISIALLDPNKRNFYPPVKEFDALVESIQMNGLIEPLTVIPSDDGRYRLISGHNRLNALRQLYATEVDNRKWEQVPCLVLPAMTEAQECCAVIEGNRQRVKGGALLAEEARKLTEAYVARKEAGESFNGRIRDRVAEALQVSATKIATVQAIENNLKVPGFLEQWRTGDASESVLYEISKLPKDAQLHLWDEQCDGRFLTVDYVKKFSTALLFCPHNCPHTGSFCENAVNMVRDHYRNGEMHCAGCCDRCLRKDVCVTRCKRIPEPECVTKFREEQAAKREAEAAERAKRERVYNEAGQKAWARLVAAAQDRGKGLSFVLRALAWDGTERDCDEMRQRASGEIMGEGNSTILPIHPFEECAVEDIVATADLLDVSVDWILGRTDEMTLAAAPYEGQMYLAAWMPGGSMPAHDCSVVMEFDLGERKNKMLGVFDAAKGKFLFKASGDPVAMEPVRWIALPE